MGHYRVPSNGLALRSRRRAGFRLPSTVIVATILGIAGVVGLSMRGEMPAEISVRISRAAPPADTPQVAALTHDSWLLDLGLSAGSESLRFQRGTPWGPAFQAASAPVSDAPVASVPASGAQAEPLSPVIPLAQEPEQLADLVPMPVPRPLDLTRPDSPEPPKLAERSLPRRTRTAVAQAPALPVDNRSFFEKLFNVQPKPDRPPSTALAYASLDGGAVEMGRGRGLAVPQATGSATAVYDITARVVYLPNGERLEAHSGLGDKLDDPRFVHMRMVGATPPGTYDLTEREALFHGVRAIRLNPVGGSGAIHGRAGLLAHTYMLGPNGDSNGCISFKDYQRFLQAFLRGEVRRLVVVTGRGDSIGSERIGRLKGSPLRADDA